MSLCAGMAKAARFWKLAGIDGMCGLVVVDHRVISDTRMTRVTRSLNKAKVHSSSGVPKLP
jgi:hypothetical protein